MPINPASLCSQQKVNDSKSSRLRVNTVKMPLKTGAMLLPVKPESPRGMQRQRIISIVFRNSVQASVADANVVLEQNRARCIRMKSSHGDSHGNLWERMIWFTTRSRPVFLFRAVHYGVGKINPAQLLTPPLTRPWQQEQRWRPLTATQGDPEVSFPELFN